MVEVNGEVRTLYDVVCRIYDANMMLRAIAELDPFQQPIAVFSCWTDMRKFWNWIAYKRIRQMYGDQDVN